MCAQRVKASTTQMANVLTGTQRRVSFRTRVDQSESITKTVLTRELLNSQDSHTQRINDQIFNLSNHNIIESEYLEFQEVPLAKKVTQNTQENYPYTTDLIALEAHRPTLPDSCLCWPAVSRPLSYLIIDDKHCATTRTSSLCSISFRG